MKNEGVKVKCQYCGTESIQPKEKVVYVCKKCKKKNIIYNSFELYGKLKRS